MNASTTAQGGLSNKVLGPDAISGEHSTILSDRSADADADAVSAETEVDRDCGGCGVASRDGGEASAADAAAAESSPSAKRFKLDDGSSAPAPLPLPDTAAAATATARNTPGGPSGGGGDDGGEEPERRRPSSSLEASSSTSISTSTSTSADVAAAAATVAEQSPEVRIISSTGAGGIPPTSPEVRILSLDGNYFSDGDEKEGGNGNGDDDDGDVDDDEVKVACCNVTNATVQYAHPRHQCGVRRFHTSGSPSALAGNAEVCPKCYCYVCDVPAGECSLWSVHCHAHSGDDRYVAERRRRKAEGKVVEIGSDGDAEATDLARAERMSVLRGMGVAVPASVAAATVDDAVQAYYRKMGSALEESGADVTLLPEDAGEGGGEFVVGDRQRMSMNIRDILMANLARARSLAAASAPARTAAAPSPFADGARGVVDGDLPRLNLHPSFYVEGIKIGWPYPSIMTPQRKMAIHLIKALKNSRHVVLESPTGTGKSAAILCSVLAWHRHHSAGRGRGAPNSDGKPVRIVYCSRTHSQVTQMVASLRRTPYRPVSSAEGATSTRREARRAKNKG